MLNILFKIYIIYVLILNWCKILWGFVFVVMCSLIFFLCLDMLISMIFIILILLINKDMVVIDVKS